MKQNIISGIREREREREREGERESKRTSHTCGHPVGVHEQNGLRTALLSRACIRVLIAHPADILGLRHVRPQHLPVKPRILQK